ncbi:hypothetical protein SteCoe_205 [Stentor coeruleus]|uniref:Uncharacterized protein n=1 Tax=Stentor coeruleus TaxID=5963 RepID=A0A1R2D4P7_9CILI|nr:hypothetical protein SteCoe_205 [Stentor coeruleus]
MIKYFFLTFLLLVCAYSRRWHGERWYRNHPNHDHDENPPHHRHDRDENHPHHRHDRDENHPHHQYDYNLGDNFKHNHENYENIYQSNDDNHEPIFYEKNKEEEEINVPLNTPFCECPEIYENDENQENYMKSIKQSEKELSPYFQNISESIKDYNLMIVIVVSSFITTIVDFMVIIIVWIAQKTNMLNENLLKSLTSFACGGFLGDVFIDFLPRITNSRRSGELIILSILGFFTLDKEVSCESPQKKLDSKNKSDEKDKSEEKYKKKSLKDFQQDNLKEIPIEKNNKDKKVYNGIIVLFWIVNLLLSIIIGIDIGSSYLINPTIGIVTTFYMLINEIFYNTRNTIAFLKFGMSYKNLVITKIIGCIGSLIGGVIAFKNVVNDDIIDVVLAIVVGNLLYASFVSLLPSIKAKRSMKWHIVLFCIGVILRV